MNEKAIIAEAIKRARDESQLSQGQFAKAARVSLQTICRIEKEPNTVSLDLLLQVLNSVGRDLLSVLLEERQAECPSASFLTEVRHLSKALVVAIDAYVFDTIQKQREKLANKKP